MCAPSALRPTIYYNMYPLSTSTIHNEMQNIVPYPLSITHKTHQCKLSPKKLVKNPPLSPKQRPTRPIFADVGGSRANVACSASGPEASGFRPHPKDQPGTKCRQGHRASGSSSPNVPAADAAPDLKIVGTGNSSDPVDHYAPPSFFRKRNCWDLFFVVLKKITSRKSHGKILDDDTTTF